MALPQNLSAKIRSRFAELLLEGETLRDQMIRENSEAHQRSSVGILGEYTVKQTEFASYKT